MTFSQLEPPITDILNVQDQIAAQVRDADVIVILVHQAHVHQTRTMPITHISILMRKNVSTQNLQNYGLYIKGFIISEQVYSD